MNLKLYRKQNGQIMIYANGSNGVSVGISDTVYTSKFTKGQKNTWDEFWQYLNESEKIEFTGDFNNHTEDKVILDNNLKLMITDIAMCGGQKVDTDGAYLLYKNQLIKI